MDIDDFYLWNITPEPVSGCEIKCTECGEWSHHEKWEESFIDCEICGDHDAMICPNCNESLDRVFTETESRLIV